MNTLSQKVPLGEKIGYSLGDAAANLVFQMMMIYQLKFYTDVFGLEGAIAGTVLLIARIVDAFVDPTVGILSDKTQTRWGKFRPWVVWTALPFMVSRHRGQGVGCFLCRRVLRPAHVPLFLQQYALQFVGRRDDERHQGAHEHHFHPLRGCYGDPVRGARLDLAVGAQVRTRCRER